ncbi:DEKNAAC102674 [Brettanomyces naardenensis]|uniref:DNA-directed RNA polymerase III subunit n=1 Tax=Brettanomyces naardenensis TaxID=13370 RepID=A0A448YKH5_BRENA|nr:DEKNAAC102674 [Brettanomyces naardenensis]
MSFRRRGPRTLLPFGLDYADVDQSASGERMLYPLPINGRPTIVEDDSAKQFTHFAELMKNGSFYMGTLESLNHTDKKKSASYLEGGVNDGLTRYSDKFRTKIKVGRSIRDHPFILEFFPDELHNVMVPKDKKTRSLQLTHYSKGDKQDIGKLIKLSEVEKKKQIQERLDTVDGNEAESDTNVEEDEDEEFEDDYDDDYNAERYFEDGDDLGGEEEEGGNDEAAF